MLATPAATPAPSLLSIDQVAAILALNVRTVRNYVRSGSLKATRIGKQYRIGIADLEAFTGRPLRGADGRTPSPARVDISSVINIEGASAAVAARITELLVATANVLHSIGQPVAFSTSYEEQLDRVRVLLAADLKSTRDLLTMINAALAEPLPASL